MGFAHSMAGGVEWSDNADAIDKATAERTRKARDIDAFATEDSVGRTDNVSADTAKAYACPKQA